MTNILGAFRATRLIFFLCGLCLSSWAPMVPYAKSRLDLDDAALGMVLLAFGVGALTTMPLTGWLVHRFGNRNVIIISGMLMIGFLPTLALASTPISLSLFLFLFGASNGALNVSMNSHAVAVEKNSDRPVMSGLHCFFSLGGLAGAAALSFLLEAGFGLFNCALSLTILMSIALASQYPYLFPASADIKAAQHAKFAFPPLTVWLLAVLCFISFLAEGSMLDWSAVFLRSSHGYDTAIAGIGYAVFSVAMSVGRFAGDKLTQHFGPVAMVRMGGLLAAAGLLTAINVNWGHLELLGFLMIGFGAANIVPVLFSAAGRQPSISPGLALTVLTTLGYSGIVLGPALIGFVAEATTLSFALASVAVLLIGVSLCARIVQPEPMRAMSNES